MPIGHAEYNPVELHAPQAYFGKPLKFASGPGFANDWLTGWTDAKAKICFDIEVVTAGDYDIELSLACPPADAGSRLRISVGNESFETVVTAAPAPEIPLLHRDEAGKLKYRNRESMTQTLKLVTSTASQLRSRLQLASLPRNLSRRGISSPRDQWVLLPTA